MSSKDFQIKQLKGDSYGGSYSPFYFALEYQLYEKINYIGLMVFNKRETLKITGLDEPFFVRDKS